MQCVASLDPESAAELSRRLGAASIPAQIQSVTQDSGLEISEVLVDDPNLERACDVADAWETEREAALASRSRRRCPRCHSTQFETIPHDKLEYVWRCKECGCEVDFR